MYMIYNIVWMVINDTKLIEIVRWPHIKLIKEFYISNSNNSKSTFYIRAYYCPTANFVTI